MPKYCRKAKMLLKKVDKEISDKAGIVILSVIIFFSFNFPQHSIVYAEESRGGEVLIFSNNYNKIEEYTLTPSKHIEEEVIEIEKPKKTMHVYATAYNSLPEQTDSTPCITANGYNLCEFETEDTIAANFLPFGTRVRIPDYFGERVFIVRDRMNARYENRIDVWMKEYKDARKFGKRYLKIEVLEDIEENQIAINTK